MEQKRNDLIVQPATVYVQDYSKWDMKKKLELLRKYAGVFNTGGLMDGTESCKRVRYGE